MLMYWTNVALVCDMTFPHPQALAASMFTITVALLIGNAKSLAPLTATVTALMDYNYGVLVVAASVWINTNEQLVPAPTQTSEEDGSLHVDQHCSVSCCRTLSRFFHIHIFMRHWKLWITPVTFVEQFVGGLSRSLLSAGPLPLFTSGPRYAEDTLLVSSMPSM